MNDGTDGSLWCFDPALLDPRHGAGQGLADLFNALPLGLIGLNASGRILVWNAAMERLLGPAGDFLGTPIAEVLHRLSDPMRSEDFPRMILEEGLKLGKAGRVDAYPVKRLDGAIRLVDVRVHPFSSGSGPIRALVVVEDATERRLAAEREVRSARSSSLTALGAAIAHEVRNPLNSIALNLQLLKEGIESLTCDERPELLEEVETVLEEISRLDRMVVDILRFARDTVPALERGDPSQALVHALRLIAPEARKKGIRIVRDIAPLPGVEIDENLLSRALFNIGRNAVQAMDAGGTLTVRSEAGPHAARIEMSDTGPGIAPENREKVFEVFFSGRRDGTGLGLPIAHRIVEGHGGHITVHSAPEGGAMFTVHLPWADAARGAQPNRRT